MPAVTSGWIQIYVRKMGKKIQNLTLVSWKLVHLPEVGEVGDNDADELERTGPRHDQPEIDKGDSSSPEGEGEASAGGEHNCTRG